MKIANYVNEFYCVNTEKTSRYQHITSQQLPRLLTEQR